MSTREKSNDVSDSLRRRRYRRDMEAVKALDTLIAYADEGLLRPTDHLQDWMLKRLKERMLRTYNN